MSEPVKPQPRALRHASPAFDEVFVIMAAVQHRPHSSHGVTRTGRRKIADRLRQEDWLCLSAPECSDAGMKVVPAFVAAMTLLMSGAIADPLKWEKDMAAFEQADREHPAEKGGIVFTGSSTIRRWKTLEQDFAGQRVLNRGFGGSQLEDVAHFAKRILVSHQPSMVVVFAGSNDINAGKEPGQVFESFKAFIAAMHESLPKTEICYLEITSSPSRWTQRDKVIEANRMIRALCEQTPGVKFVPVREKLLGANGEPREELFGPDRLHPNADGYRIIADAIRPFLPKP
jgi:lysophospholipase L1-like esterase